MLNVSIDSLVTGEKEQELGNEEKSINEWDWNCSRLSFLIQWIISTRYLDFVDRFISFYCHEAENALKRRDTALLEELAVDWYPDGLLHDYVWNKIKVEVDDDEYF